ncbi:plasmid partitioning protein RepB [Sagittula sp. SSi028]|uniref:plasmid partitioning protein RepB n=1 Tax=Sagittula sp. SSi028 TaxID=3400636 RepID=UPI003AF97DE4
MARKTLGGMSGIASTIARSGPQAAKDRPARSSAPALGALQGSLTAIREIDPALIDDWGPRDRMEGFTAVKSDDEGEGFDALVESIREGGQQVPILLRRAPTDGRFEVIYGRRRLAACRELGIKVKANVQDLDDDAALLAKGLENAARRNLSFYEKARFAAMIAAAGHDSKTARQVLGLSASGLSHLNKIIDNVPDDVGDQIGAAPKSGRPKWTALADAFAGQKITASAALGILAGFDASMGSDERLDQLLKEITRRGARPAQSRETTPVEGITVKSGKAALSVNISKAGTNAAFGKWLDDNIDQIIREQYRTFTAVNDAD